MNTKKLSMMVLSLSMTVVFTFGGATMALFTSSAQNSNTATAGTINLDAKRDHGDYTPGPMFYPDSLDPNGNHPYDKSEVSPSGESLGGWAPGDTVQRTMILTNNGSLDAKIHGLKATVRDSYTQNLLTGGSRTVNGGLTSGAEYDEFIQKANVKVMVPDQNLLLYNGPLSALLVSGYAPLQNEPVLQGIPVPGFQPGPLNVTFEVHLDNSATNQIQGKSFIFDFGFYAEQVRNNNTNTPFGDQSWQADGPGNKSVTKINTNTVQFHYDNNTWGNFSGEWTYTTNTLATKTETINFNYDYSGLHSWYMATARARAFADGPSGRVYYELYNDPNASLSGNGFSTTGTASIHVTTGYNYGFVLDGSHFDASYILQGTFKATRTN
jgi:hypothetical protein